MFKNCFLIDIGVGVFYFNCLDQVFDEVRGLRVELFMCISLYILANKQIDFIVDVFVNLNFQFQGVYKEWLINFGGWVFFDKIFGSVIVFELSCGYCFNNELGDVVYLIIGI